MTGNQTALVIGRGEVHFNAFQPGTKRGLGERYFGNTTTFQVGRRVERLERFTAYRGQKVEQEGEVIGEGHTVQFITDHIDMENVAMWFGGEQDNVTQAASGPITENLLAAPGYTLQLGQTVDAMGVRGVSNVQIAKQGEPVPRAGNYVVDNASGRLTILADATHIERGDLLAITFQWRTVAIKLSRSGTRQVHGALRFVATNPYGPRKHYFFPYVRLTSRGQFDLKGDEWQQIPFEATTMRLNPYSEQLYVEEILSIGFTRDEQGIIDFSGLTLDEFPYWENEVNTLVNTTIPNHDY